MPSTELVPFTAELVPHTDGAPDLTPLTFRYVEIPGECQSLICEGPLGAVELQVHPQDPLTAKLGGTCMSVAYHSRQPNPCSGSAYPNCEVLGGDCYPDWGSGGVQGTFEPLLRAGDREGVLAELARRYQYNTWTDDEDL